MNRRHTCAALLFLPLAVFAGSLQAQEAVESPDAANELYRVRLENRPGAPVEISSDGGRLWDLMGKVTRAATSVTNATNVISAVAGKGTKGYSGDGASALEAELNRPFGIAFDADGDLYISDTFNSRIRKVER